jgi:hypothetical protein
MAWQSLNHGPMGFVFVEGELVDDTALDNRTTVLLGPRTGLLWQPVSHWRLLTDAQWQWDAVNQDEEWQLSFSSAVALSDAVSFVLSGRREKIGGRDPFSSVSALLRFYF